MNDTITPGTIAILHQGDILSELDDWVGKMKETYPGQLRVVKPRGNQIPRQRNLAVQNMVGSWLLFIDSDCVPYSDTLPRLLSHNLPIVGGVILERFAPFYVAATHLVQEEDTPKKYTLNELPRHGVIRVYTAGTGCLLIQREVFGVLESPWFRCGQVHPEYLLEDTEFCLRATQAGFPIHLDCDVRVGHKVAGIAWPGKDGQRWIEWFGPIECHEVVEASR